MQDQIAARPGRLHRWCAALLDGENRWGFVRVQADRFGVTRHRLVVYPPGISKVERRWLRAWRGAPIWGTAVWAVSEIFLQQLVTPWTALAISVAIVVALAIPAFVKTGGTRTKVRAMTVITMAIRTDTAAHATRDRFLRMAATLLDADERVDQGRLSVLDDEVLWWSIYDELAPVARVDDSP